MSLPKNVTITRDGGRYWPAMAFRYSMTILLVTPIFVALVIAILNPLWFRDRLFTYIENKVAQVTKWRNYKTYAIYLGCDPAYWHTLAGDK